MFRRRVDGELVITGLQLTGRDRQNVIVVVVILAFVQMLVAIKPKWSMVAVPSVPSAVVQPDLRDPAEIDRLRNRNATRFRSVDAYTESLWYTLCSEKPD